MAGKTITIDGPGGSGKSTVARLLAEKLGFAFLDSGAIYRAATWFALERGLDLQDVPAVLSSIDELDLRMEESPTGMLVFVNSIDVTGEIRTRRISNNVFHLANNGDARGRLMDYQRSFSNENDLVAEGRDMGSVVFPDASLKFYLTAGLDVRAERRRLDLVKAGDSTELADVKEEIRVRDGRDSNREVAPLRKPEGAVEVDSSDYTIDEVIAVMIEEARSRNLV